MIDNFEEIKCFTYLNEGSNIRNMQDEFDFFKSIFLFITVHLFIDKF